MYCKTCGRKLDGTEKFCSDCGSPIDYADEVMSRDELRAAAPKREGGLDFKRATFHLDDMDWDLKGYPVNDKKTDIVDFDWASVLEGKEKQAAEERRRAIAMSEEDIYDRIQSDRHNDEFDWDLVHTMRIDKAGRSDLSLFHEDDEELFSVDFIPPLNTANSYDNMVPEEKEAPEPSKGTIVIDRIDKSGIEKAANEAAGIKERDYEALGIATGAAGGVAGTAAVGAAAGQKKRIEKFYTFNRKNEEFQALLDEEYERIRQKVQAETEQEELKNAVLAAVEESAAAEGAEAEGAADGAAEAEPVAEPVPLTREEQAKVAAESEADEAERLAEEAERIAAEAEARAKAAEEAAAKAAAEAAAAEEALRVLEEEEAAAEEAARIAAEEEAARLAEEAAAEEARLAEEAKLAEEAAEEARLAEEAAAEEARLAEEAAAEEAAEEAARIAQEKADAAAAEASAAEEAARQAEEEAQRLAAEEEAKAAAEEVARLEEEARAAEEAAAALAHEAETRAKAAQLAAEEAAVDAELEKLNESHRALEAAVAEIEAEMQEGGEEEYDDDEEEVVERKMSYTDIFEDDDDDDYDLEKKGGCKTLFLDLLIVVLVIAVGIAAMLVFLPDHAISQRIRDMLPFGKAPVIEQETADETADAGTENQETATEPEVQEPELTDIETAIANASALASGLGEVTEDSTIRFAEGADYGMEGVDIANPLENGTWYTSGSGDVTFVDGVVSTILEYYSKLMDKLNNDSNEVLNLVGEDSPLYGELSAISANPDVKHEIQKIQFGEIRSNGSDFYALVKVTEKISNAEAPEVTYKVVYLQADNDAQKMKIINIIDIQ